MSDELSLVFFLGLICIVNVNEFFTDCINCYCYLTDG